MTTFKKILPYIAQAIVGATGLAIATWYTYSVLTSASGTFRFIGI